MCLPRMKKGPGLTASFLSLSLPPPPPLSLLKPIAYPFTTTTTITTTTTTRAGATSLREPSAGSSTTPQLPTDPTIHVGPLVAL